MKETGIGDSKPGRVIRGDAAVLLAACLWGTVGLASAPVLASGVDPLTVGLFRLGLAAPLMLIVAIAGGTLRLAGFTRADILPFALIGITMAGYQAFYFASVASVGVTVATLVTICLAPALVAIGAIVVLGERLTVTIILAMIAAIGGTILLVGDSGAPLSIDAPNPWPGALLALGSAFSYAVFTLTSRVIVRRYGPETIIALGFGFGAIILAALRLPLGEIQLPANVNGWALLVYAGLIPTALAYVIFFFGMRTTPATRASLLTFSEPLTAAILAALVLGERIGPFGLIGAGLLVAALLLLNRRRSDAGSDASPPGPSRTPRT